MQEFSLILTLDFNIRTPIDFSKYKWILLAHGRLYRAIFIYDSTKKNASLFFLFKIISIFAQS